MFDLYFLWLIVAVVLAGADMLLGTFYLLILGLSAIAAFVIAVVGLSFTAQLLGFALFGIIGCVLLSLKKKKDTRRKTLDAAQIQNLNNGQIVTVEHWKEDGTADVFFRGTHWLAAAERGQTLKPGLWSITGMNANTLIIKFHQEK